MSQQINARVAVVGIDIGKNSFHIVGQDGRGEIVLRQKWSRSQVEARFANMSPCLIGMEACVGAHHLSRQLRALGHDARLMPAKYVRPYSKGQKNDFRDAEAIAEAVQRPTMKFVAMKTADQLDLQALHRVRERLVSQRTGTINQIRAFFLERGIAVRQGHCSLRAELPRILATPSDTLSPRILRIMDLYSRKIVGWAMADHLRADLPLAALAMAIAAQRPGAGLIHHSDRGVQYASAEYRKMMQSAGLRASMSRKGDCYDNAPMESFFHTLKTELVHHRHYATREEATRDIFAYIEGFYNRTRRHSAIGYVTPIEMELKAA